MATRRGRPHACRGEETRPRGAWGSCRYVRRIGLCRREYGGDRPRCGHHQALAVRALSDKRAVFADVIPWALARFTDGDVLEDVDDEDVETALLALGRASLARATDPQNVRLKRIAFNEAASFPEFNVSAESMMWAGRLRAATEVLRLYDERGSIKRRSRRRGRHRARRKARRRRADAPRRERAAARHSRGL